MSFSEKNELFHSQSVISINFIQKKVLTNYYQEYGSILNRYIAWYEIPLEYEHVSLLIRDN